MRAKLGKYEIKAELGRGSMGVVYEGRDPRLGRSVALKTMSPSVAGDPDLLTRFYREAQSAGQLHHPNIVTIYDIDDVEGIPFIAMEFLEGESLEKLIAARRNVPVVKKLDIIIQTLRGLHYAHEHGIVHRDVKPANIQVLTDGLVKILDFGIARIGGGSMTRTGMVMGTPMFMSPEQVVGQTVDARSDIFSVGVILYELLAYQNPFLSEDVQSILYKILNVAPAPLSSLLPNVPPQLENIVTRALAKNREERFQSAEDMAFELQRVADSLKRHMVEIYIKEGERSLAEGNYTVAKESLQKVLEVDSDHNVAKELLAKVQEEIYSRQRTQKVEHGLRQAKEAIQAEQFDEAVSALDEILRLEPGHAEALQYKQYAAESRERTRKVKQSISRAEKLLADADLAGAKTQLEGVLSLDPEHAEARRMLDSVVRDLSEQDRQRQVRKHTEAARARLAEKDFGKAGELLEKALQLDPMNIEVESLVRLVRSGQQKEERRKLLEQRVTAIEDALGRGVYDQALKLAEAALGEFPEDPEVLKLHTEASRETESQKKRRFIDEQIQAARDFIQKGQYSSAIALLERALENVPGDARLSSYLKTVREAQETANLDSVRQDAIREAKELILKKDYPRAIQSLEKALARAGQSPELLEFLEWARSQQADQQRQERVKQVLSKAQAGLRDENFEETVRTLEKAAAELKAPEVDALLKSAQDEWKKYEERRETLMKHANELLQAGDPGRAVAELDRAPRSYFKNEPFQRVYAQCREGVSRATYIQGTLSHVEKALSEEDYSQAEAVLAQALKIYGGDPALLGAEKRAREERAATLRREARKKLDEIKVEMGRMRFREAIGLLTAADWRPSGAPDIQEEARKLLEEAKRREAEIKERPTIAVPPPAVASAPSLAASQEKLREALRGTAPPPGPGMEATRIVRPGASESSTPGTPPIPSSAVETIAMTRPLAPAPSAPKPVPAPTAAPPTPSVKTPPARPPVPAVVPQPAKKTPIALWAGIGGVVLVIAAVVAWKLFTPQPIANGMVELSAVPWGEIVSLEAKDGRPVEAKGLIGKMTPVEFELPPGGYVVGLKNGSDVEKVDVTVTAGQPVLVKYPFPQTKPEEWVNDLVTSSKY